MGLAVANGRAYLLAHQLDQLDMGPGRHFRLEVYELHLESWHCHKLPFKGVAAFCNRKVTAVVAQVGVVW